MSYVSVEPGVRLYVQDLGMGPPVVLLAGFGLSHPVWDAEVRELTAAGHRAVCVDLRGTGLSDKPLGGYGVPRLADDVGAVLEALDLREVTLVGWSFGGQVALRLAAAAPAGERVGRLVLVCSYGVRASRSEAFPFGPDPDALASALIAGERERRPAARRQTITSGFAGNADPDAVAFLLSVQLQMPSWAAVACYESYLRTDLVGLLARVGVPVLQILGEQDPVTSAAGAAWVADRVPDSRIVRLPGCGHYPMLEAGDAFRAALTDFAAPAPALAPDRLP
jgi:pimeloyl-ACP methyl ester carboxylesterase